MTYLWYDKGKKKPYISSRKKQHKSWSKDQILCIMFFDNITIVHLFFHNVVNKSAFLEVRTEFFIPFCHYSFISVTLTLISIKVPICTKS